MGGGAIYDFKYIPVNAQLLETASCSGNLSKIVSSFMFCFKAAFSDPTPPPHTHTRTLVLYNFLHLSELNIMIYKPWDINIIYSRTFRTISPKNNLMMDKPDIEEEFVHPVPTILVSHPVSTILVFHPVPTILVFHPVFV